MTNLSSYSVGAKDVIAIGTVLVVLTAFAVTANITALGADEVNETQDVKIESVKQSINNLDKNVALMAQAADTQAKSVKRQEEAGRRRDEDIREVKQLLMEIARKK